tara:strand:- start:1010 stop:1288 length:279 start_codon:yes stop_codon:yes gene_type:complete
MKKYKVVTLDNEYPHDEVASEKYEDWTEAQDEAVRLLESGVEYVQIMQLNGMNDAWGLLQELNLERGIMPNPNFNTHSLAPYYVRLRDYGTK